LNKRFYDKVIPEVTKNNTFLEMDFLVRHGHVYEDEQEKKFVYSPMHLHYKLNDYKDI
jgi:hypothetical protein